jgi:hypothetical protein
MKGEDWVSVDYSDIIGNSLPIAAAAKWLCRPHA